MRTLQPINAGSMADIAFLLLIFFLVTTTIESETGLMRKLPPDEEASGEIRRRNVLNIRLNNDDDLLVNNNLMSIAELPTYAAVFIQNEDNLPHYPEKELREIEGIGETEVSKQVISLQCATHTNYESYVHVQDALAAAYLSARNDFSQMHFNATFEDLLKSKDLNKIKAVQAALPMRIGEAEPRKN